MHSIHDRRRHLNATYTTLTARVRMNLNTGYSSILYSLARLKTELQTIIAPLVVSKFADNFIYRNYFRFVRLAGSLAR